MYSNLQKIISFCIELWFIYSWARWKDIWKIYKISKRSISTIFKGELAIEDESIISQMDRGCYGKFFLKRLNQFEKTQGYLWLFVRALWSSLLALSQMIYKLLSLGFFKENRSFCFFWERRLLRFFFSVLSQQNKRRRRIPKGAMMAKVSCWSEKQGVAVGEDQW